MGKPTLEAVDSSTQPEALAFLERFEETSQFLLGNLQLYGPILTEHHNSGNYKLVRGASGEVEGVFCLTRRGNLLAQTTGDFAELILRACAQEELELKGFLGDWRTMEPIWQLFKERNPRYRPSYDSKDILYALELAGQNLPHDPRVRLLEESDFDQWKEFGEAYMEELSLPDNLTEAQLRSGFAEQVRRQVWWGLLENGALLSRAGLNASGERIGQVGGVFTPKRLRGQGLGKATMLHMLRDCRDRGQEKSILFTGQLDIPAQKLYESIGYRRIGDFAIILGK